MDLEEVFSKRMKNEPAVSTGRCERCGSGLIYDRGGTQYECPIDGPNFLLPNIVYDGGGMQYNVEE